MSTVAHTHRGDGRAARWEGQHDRRRTEFVAAALVAIAEHGPDVATAQIARQAGVARTRLYKHFDGADDLRRAVTSRVTELLDEQLEPVWNPHGTPREMITVAVDTYLRWVTEHRNLYRYLLRYGPHGGWGDIRTTLGEHLTRLFAGYLDASGVSTIPAQTMAFGLVGFAESATNRWLEHPEGLPRDRLVGQIADGTWAVLEAGLRDCGITLDPDEPLRFRP